MKSLIRSWWENLSYFTASSLKQWGLVVFKSSLATYKILMQQFWWLFILLGVLSYYSIHYKYYLFLVPYAFLAIALWFVCCLLAVRPSVEKKDMSYFLRYWGHGLIAFTAIVIMSVGLLIVQSPLVFQTCKNMLSHVHISGMCSSLIGFISTLLKFTLVYILFFLFDNKLSPHSVGKSIWNGIKLVYWVLPVHIVLLLLVQIMWFGLWYIDLLHYGDVVILVGCFLFPVYLHVLLYIYIKEIYTHGERY